MIVFSQPKGNMAKMRGHTPPWGHTIHSKTCTEQNSSMSKMTIKRYLLMDSLMTGSQWCTASS